ncbi:MAG TPA: hypothetical protein VFU04_03810 [Solirubrobacterales bacterium]|nr:hypothetical protein [Solirubrobacterales bacterium]
MKPLISDKRRRVSVLPWPARKLADLEGAGPYDALLASVGYEPRSRAIAEGLGELPGETVAVEFQHPRPRSYEESLEWFEKQNVEINQEWDERFLPWLLDWLKRIAARHEEARVAIDVSSMNRPRIAAVVQAIGEMPSDARIVIDLLYAPSCYSPPKKLPDGVLTLRPVSAYLSGQLRSQASPVALVGLGYEPHRAAGVFDSLEIRRVIAYVPVGPHRDFHDTVLEANQGLLGGPEEHLEVDYEVLDPFDCVVRLDGRVHGLLQAGDVPALVPLGPKIFALSACLVAAMHHPHVSVWRASFDKDELALKRRADEWACGITLALAPALPSADEAEVADASPA